MRSSLAAALALAATLALAPAAPAAVWTEVGDAGDLPASAQLALGVGPLDQVVGRLESNNDVDFYLIFVTGGGDFSATTVGQAGTLGNSQLFLFDLDGRGVYANDDASAATARSTLPAGNPLTPVAAGYYYLAISSFDHDPVSATGLIFPSFPFTGVFGPTGPGAVNPVSGFGGAGTDSGTYVIALTGATLIVPEPAGLALAGTAAGLLALAWRRRAA